jgi:hypothetical protein
MPNGFVIFWNKMGLGEDVILRDWLRASFRIFSIKISSEWNDVITAFRIFDPRHCVDFDDLKSPKEKRKGLADFGLKNPCKSRTT